MGKLPLVALALINAGIAFTYFRTGNFGLCFTFLCYSASSAGYIWELT